MDTERIRPSVYVSYDVDLSVQGHALEYFNLSFKYLEETVEERGRGYAVIAKSEPQQFRIVEPFGAMNVYFSESPRQHE